MIKTAKTSFLPKQISGKGWTVVQRTGSKRAGYTETQVGYDGLTLAQAQATAITMARDFARHGQV